MKVLIIGATGYFGSVLTETLLSAGHEVVAMVRSPRVLADGTTQRIADLGDVDAVSAAVGADVDAVVHAATPLGDWQRDRLSVRAAMRALGSPDKRFVYISGVWVLGGSTRADGSVAPHDETAPADPIALVAGREALEHEVLTGPVTGIVVRPGILHGRGGGIPALLRKWAVEAGHGVFLGADDRVTWPTVHVEDAAALVALALEDGTPGQILHAVAEPAVLASEIAAAADDSVGGRGVAHRRSPRAAAVEVGAAFAEALALSQRVQSLVAPTMGWRPSRPGIVEDLRFGSYARVATRPGPTPDVAAVDAWTA